MVWFDNTVFILIILTMIYLFHTVVSFLLIKKGREKLTKGRLKNFVQSLTVTFAIFFFYMLWNHYIKLGAINMALPVTFIVDNIIIMVVLLSLVYLAFKIKELGETFGVKK